MTKGRKHAATTAAQIAAQTIAARRPRRRQTYTSAGGTSTAGKILAEAASPSWAAVGPAWLPEIRTALANRLPS